MPQTFDLVVIGSGTAGQIPAYQCRKAGWSVAMVESHLPGGTCANSGCDAKKPFSAASSLLNWSRRMSGHGIEGSLRADWPTLMAFKRSFTDPIPDNTRQDLREAGIVLLEGIGRFIDHETVGVGAKIVRGKKIVIATGMTPRPLRIKGEELAITSDQFLELNQLPQRIIFIGGGYISMEFAHIAASCGSDVTILEQLPRVLNAFESSLVDTLVDCCRNMGIRIETGSCVDGIRQQGGEVFAECSNRGTSFSGDLVVHGAGRVPAVADLDLNLANVAYGDQGVIVDETLRSVSNPQVYAAGDVAASGGPPLTPVSALEGVVVAHNLLHDEPRIPDYLGVPSVVFTEPPLAGVGLTEEEAVAGGIKVKVIEGRMDSWKLLQQEGVSTGRYKVLIDEELGRICGGHVFGSQAEEVINLLALAVRLGLKPEIFRRTLYAYPSIGNKLASLVK